MGWAKTCRTAQRVPGATARIVDRPSARRESSPKCTFTHPTKVLPYVWGIGFSATGATHMARRINAVGSEPICRLTRHRAKTTAQTIPDIVTLSQTAGYFVGIRQIKAAPAPTTISAANSSTPTSTLSRRPAVVIGNSLPGQYRKHRRRSTRRSRCSAHHRRRRRRGRSSVRGYQTAGKKIEVTVSHTPPRVTSDPGQPRRGRFRQHRFATLHDRRPSSRRPLVDRLES